jgi:hypothetical protein
VWLLIVSVACAPKPVAPPTVANVVAPVAPAAPAPVEPKEPPPAVAEAALAPAPAAPTDARTLANTWRVYHNEGVARLEAGDAPGALVKARASLALAPAGQRCDPLLLVALSAGAAGEITVELDALEDLAAEPRAPWGAFYNGSLDAAIAGRKDLASRLAQVALARTPDVATVGPVALRAALDADQLDAALATAARFAADPADLADLRRALVAAGRCADAKKLGAEKCP